jgi:hypothetical protein
MTRRCRRQPACATPHATLDAPSNSDANAAPTPTHLHTALGALVPVLQVPADAPASEVVKAFLGDTVAPNDSNCVHSDYSEPDSEVR